MTHVLILEDDRASREALEKILLEYSDSICVHAASSYDEAKELLNSDIGELVRKMDADDGSYDGKVSVDIYNEWRVSKGYKPVVLAKGETALPFIDVVKGCYGILRNEAQNK